MKRIDKAVEGRLQVIQKNLEAHIENYSRQDVSGTIIREDLAQLFRMVTLLASSTERAADTLEDNLYTGEPPRPSEGVAKGHLYENLLVICAELGINPREL